MPAIEEKLSLAPVLIAYSNALQRSRCEDGDVLSMFRHLKIDVTVESLRFLLPMPSWAHLSKGATISTSHVSRTGTSIDCVRCGPYHCPVHLLYKTTSQLRMP